MQLPKKEHLLTPPPYQTIKRKQETPALTAKFEAGKKNILSLLLHNQSSAAKEKLMATRSSAKRVHAHGLDPLAVSRKRSVHHQRTKQTSTRQESKQGRRRQGISTLNMLSLGIWPMCQYGRVVKAIDLKSIGVPPRRFEPCCWRIYFVLFVVFYFALHKSFFFFVCDDS